MAYNIERISNAAELLQNGTVQQKNEAAQILYRWQDSRNSIMEACKIITTSDNDSLLFQVSLVAKNSIIKRWIQYPNSDRIFIRDSICQKLVGFNGSDLIKSQLIELIAHIALKDWPHDWEDCMSGFMDSIGESAEICVLDLSVIASIISIVHSTDTITSFRKTQLIELINNLTPKLMEVIEWSLENYNSDSVSNAVIGLMAPLCLTAPFDVVLRPGMLQGFLTSYVLDPKTKDKAIEAASNLLFSRTDSMDLFTHVFNDVLEVFVYYFYGDLEEENHTPPEMPLEMYVFILKFMERYSEKIEELCYYMDQTDDVLIEIVTLVYNGILERPPTEEHIEEFWALWRNILRRICRANQSNNKYESLHPCSLLFTPLMDQIRLSLYAAFESAQEDCKIKSISTQTAWVFLASVDIDEMIAFLSQQAPSPSLCYAIGLIDCCLKAATEIEFLKSMLPTMIDFNNRSESIEMGSALLFLLSRSLRFISRFEPLLQAFGSCLCTFFNDPNTRVQQASANALHYAAFRHPSMFLHKENPLFLNFLNNVGQWIEKIEEKAAIKLSKALSFIASSHSDVDERKKFYELIFSPVYHLISTGDHESTMKSIKIIRALSLIKLVDAQDLFILFLEPLLSLVENTRDTNDEYIFSETSNTLIHLFSLIRYDMIQDLLHHFVEILLNCEELKDVALVTLNGLRQTFEACEIYNEDIYMKYVEPQIDIMKATKNEALGVIRFFRSFHINEEKLDSLVDLSLLCISGERIDIAKEASKLLRKILLLYKEHKNLQPVVDKKSKILSIVFGALTDTLHNQIFNNLTKTLNAFFQAMLISSYPKPSLDKDVGFSVAHLRIEKQVMDTFPSILRNCVHDIGKFSHELRELLISIKCASATDKGLFKRELKLDTIRKELELLCDIEEKSAIKAEELEILPALSKLSINK